MFKRLIVVTFFLAFIQPVYAKTKGEGVFLYFTNNLSQTGKAAIGECESPPGIGPVVEKNGGTAEWLYYPPGDEGKKCLVSMSFQPNSGSFCQSGGKLDLSKYKHDAIHITFTRLENGLQCTCSGSACV